MKKLPRVQSTAKTAEKAAQDLNQMQSGAFPVIEAALKQVVNAESFTATVTVTVFEGYLQLQTEIGTFWVPTYSAPP